MIIFLILALLWFLVEPFSGTGIIMLLVAITLAKFLESGKYQK